VSDDIRRLPASAKVLIFTNGIIAAGAGLVHGRGDALIVTLLVLSLVAGAVVLWVRHLIPASVDREPTPAEAVEVAAGDAGKVAT